MRVLVGMTVGAATLTVLAFVFFPQLAWPVAIAAGLLGLLTITSMSRTELVALYHDMKIDFLLLFGAAACLMGMSLVPEVHPSNRFVFVLAFGVAAFGCLLGLVARSVRALIVGGRQP